MPGKSHHTPANWPRKTGLRLAVHAQALALDPGGYLAAIGWWISGKRLRAKMQLAPLLGRTKSAYRLWQALQPLLSSSSQISSHLAREPVRLRALIAQGDGTSRTLESCRAEGIDACIVNRPDDLARNGFENADWIMPLQPGDTLAKGAGAIYREAATNALPAASLIYADDDLIDDDGRRSKPHLKPDWNSELFQHFDFLTFSCLVRTRVLAPESVQSSDWAAELTRQAVGVADAQTASPRHVHEILHHRRSRPAPQLPLAPLTLANASSPSVSVIIPTRNRVKLLRVCLDGLSSTDYQGAVEIVVIDNGSDDPETLDYLAGLDPDFVSVVRDDGPFNFAALNNRAAARARGDALCFLNNDIEVHSPDWLSIMAHQAMRDDVGAVGARLLYPDGRIQHAGVILGIGGAAAHPHRGLNPEEEGYFHRHSLTQFTSAITAACMVVERTKFEAVGGFDAKNFAVSFNDVDLCLRLNEQGWRSLYEPRATLVHHESVSRGFDRDRAGAARQARETLALRERWDTGLAPSQEQPKSRDPFHHPGLSPLSEQFVLRV